MNPERALSAYYQLMEIARKLDLGLCNLMADQACNLAEQIRFSWSLSDETIRTGDWKLPPASE